MHWDLFGMDLDNDTLEEIAFSEDEVKETKREDFKSGLNEDGPEDLREAQKESKDSLILISKINMARCFLIMALFGFARLGISIFNNSMIIALGAHFVRILSFITILGSILPSILIIKYSFNILKNTKEIKEIDNEPEEKLELLSKKEYIGISDVKKDLLALKNKVSYNFQGEKGEDIIAKKIIDQCLSLLKKIENLQSALKVILSRSEEYSLEEVINTLKHAEENIGKNIFKITNRILLELNVEGFDKGKIDLYLQNNEDIVNESTKLVKESLEYIENKDNLEDNTVGIETLTETIQSLKNQLDKGGNNE
ncbi:hypothetical protein [uncultured Clostridium sp.]|uniref:hypothetical protein n=1 Tax=uncultured Clostridium sp. TaxID=59620 RepID=UPI0026289686|nr:hypothetical protein [uncultured Clostridium sp.]